MFENMSVSDLKTYLHERGVSVNGCLEPALIEIANAVEKMMLPVVEKEVLTFCKHHNLWCSGSICPRTQSIQRFNFT